MTKTQIKNMQEALQKRGFYAGSVDGIWGAMSQAGFNAAMDAARQCRADHQDASLNKEPEKPVATGKFRLSANSLAKLNGVHPDLVKVVKRAIEITERDFVVTEGLRNITRQKALYNQGATRTMNSRHLTGHAVDLVPIDETGKITWEWKPYYFEVEKAMKAAAKELGVKIEWGGDWKTFKDGPHYQLPW